jgi:hypothetical protein
VTPVLLKRRFKAMGGPCELNLWLDPGEPVANQALFDCLQAELGRLEAKYSRFKTHSQRSVEQSDARC